MSIHVVVTLLENDVIKLLQLLKDDLDPRSAELTMRLKGGLLREKNIAAQYADNTHWVADETMKSSARFDENKGGDGG